MVTGFTKFKEKFKGFENQYVVIGGTACDLLMESEDMTFRATKDIDIVLIVESITAESRQELSEEIAADMKWFLYEMKHETIDLKSLGVRGSDQKTILSLLYRCYGIE